jgi:hypothetical protein
VERRSAHSFDILVLQSFGTTVGVNTCAAAEVRRGGNARAHNTELGNHALGGINMHLSSLD